ncbi:MAG: fibronectin type III domain-containing protein [Lachnospiraceae bacterium]|nr:fibronectin type III domain-containing protein [Lachnospiraceae bacterium]
MKFETLFTNFKISKTRKESDQMKNTTFTKMILIIFAAVIFTAAIPSAAAAQPLTESERAELDSLSPEEFEERYPNELPEELIVPGGLPAGDLIPVAEGVDIVDLNEETVLIDGELLTGEAAAAEEPLLRANAVLPSKWRADEAGRTTKVKLQKLQDCWAFAFCAMSESSLISTKLADQSIDLSEAYTNYATWMDYYKDLNYSFHDRSIMGSNFIVAVDPVIKGYGPVLEKNAPYEALTKLQDRNQYSLSDSVYNSHAFEYERAYYADYSDRDAVKRLIYELGGAMTAFYSHMDSTTGYGFYLAGSRVLDGAVSTDIYHTESVCYTPKEMNWQNHAVELVGWDDSFPASAFKVRPEGDGAWLIKNSWGTDCNYGNGYVWISYYDKTLDGVQAIRYQKNGTIAQSLYPKRKDIYLYPGKSADITFFSDAETVTNFPVRFKNLPYLVTSELINDQGCIKTFRFTCKASKVTPGSEDEFQYRLEKPKTDTYNIVTQEGTIKIHYGMPTLSAHFSAGSEECVDIEDGSAVSMTKGSNGSVNAYMLYDITYCNENHGVLFRSSNPSVAEINADGYITAKSYGSTTITVENDDPDIPIRKSFQLAVVSAGIRPEQFDVLVVDCQARENDGSVYTYKEKLKVFTREGDDVSARIYVPASANGKYYYQNGVLACHMQPGCESAVCQLCWENNNTVYTADVTVTRICLDHDRILKSPEYLEEKTINPHDGMDGYQDTNCKFCGQSLHREIIPADTKPDPSDDVTPDPADDITPDPVDDVTPGPSDETDPDSSVHTCDKLTCVVERKMDLSNPNEMICGCMNYYCSKCHSLQLSCAICYPWIDDIDHIYAALDYDKILLVKGVDYTVSVADGQYRINFTDACKYYSGSIDTWTYVPADPDPYVDPFTQPQPDASTYDDVDSYSPTFDDPDRSVKPSKQVKISKPSKVTGLKVKKKKNGRLQISWKKAKQADKYEVWISSSKNFKNPVKRTVSANKITVKMPAGKKYYVKVRAINKKGIGKFSKKGSCRL